MEKKKPGYADRVCIDCYSRSNDCSIKLFPNIHFYEGIILEAPCHSLRLYLTHGHQADFWNSTAWKVNRFLVRYLWRPLEHFGVLDPTNAAKNYKHKSRIEKRLSSYAKDINYPLITGHTHRPRLNLEDSLFINTGSCVHPDSITCIEIEGFQISLIKWYIDTKNDRTLYVKREVLSQSTLLS